MPSVQNGDVVTFLRFRLHLYKVYVFMVMSISQYGPISILDEIPSVITYDSFFYAIILADALQTLCANVDNLDAVRQRPAKAENFIQAGLKTKKARGIEGRSSIPPTY